MNNQAPITNNQINSKTQIPNPKKFDLEDRTFIFSQRILRLVKALPKNSVNLRLADQLVRSGTSVGANYCEANETDTKKDFQNKIRICRKEAKETLYWMKLIGEANSDIAEKTSALLVETQELVKIFASIGRNSGSY